MGWAVALIGSIELHHTAAMGKLSCSIAMTTPSEVAAVVRRQAGCFGERE